MILTPKQTKPPTILDKLIQTKLKKKDAVLEQTLEAASETIQEKVRKPFSWDTTKALTGRKMCWEGLRKKEKKYLR